MDMKFRRNGHISIDTHARRLERRFQFRGVPIVSQQRFNLQCNRPRDQNVPSCPRCQPTVRQFRAGGNCLAFFGELIFPMQRDPAAGIDRFQDVNLGQGGQDRRNFQSLRISSQIRQSSGRIERSFDVQGPIEDIGREDDS